MHARRRTWIPSFGAVGEGAGKRELRSWRRVVARVRVFFRVRLHQHHITPTITMVREGLISLGWESRFLQSGSDSSSAFDDDDVWTPLKTSDFIHLGEERREGQRR